MSVDNFLHYTKVPTAFVMLWGQFALFILPHIFYQAVVLFLLYIKAQAVIGF